MLCLENGDKIRLILWKGRQDMEGYNIKYHQCGIGYDYGEDHSLTNNWDPDIDYGNEYVYVYFNINTPSYNGCGFTSTEERDKWNTEASRLIRSFGIVEDSGFRVEQSAVKHAYLYAHPNQISGVILKNDVKKVAEAICSMDSFSLRWVDLRETVYHISNQEYEEYLDGKKEEIRKALFEKAATTRTNKYYLVFDVARSVAKNVRLRRLGLNDGIDYGSGQTIEYILRVAEEMVKEGYLKSIKINGRKCIRSLNKTEQKKSKLMFERF